jgi:hypothetical protein
MWQRNGSSFQLFGSLIYQWKVTFLSRCQVWFIKPIKKLFFVYLFRSFFFLSFSFQTVSWSMKNIFFYDKWDSAFCFFAIEIIIKFFNVDIPYIDICQYTKFIKYIMTINLVLYIYLFFFTSVILTMYVCIFDCFTCCTGKKNKCHIYI